MSSISRRDLLKGMLGASALSMSGCATGPVTPEPSAFTAPQRDLIRNENQRPGTRDWLLKNTRIDPQTKYRSPSIEGYCSRTSVSAGEQISLHVSTNPQAPFTIDIYRMGYYGGTGGRHMVTLGPFPGTNQPDPPIGPKRLRECKWEPCVSLSIPPDWPSGVYLGKLTTEREQLQSYLIFIVRDQRRADFIFQCSDNTWQAYNRWPNQFSLYDNGKSQWYWGGGVDISYDRPYGKYCQIVDAPLSTGSGEWFLWEFPLAYWLESQGYDVTYISNIDTHAHPKALSRAKGFLSIGHDEYYSIDMFRNFQQAIRNGLNVAFLSGNTCCGRINLRPSTAGRPHRIFERIDVFGPPDPADFKVLPDMAQFPHTSPNANTLVGARSVAPIMGGADWICTAPDHWLFEGTGMKAGDGIPGLVGWEWHGDPGPIPGLQILATGPTKSSGGGVGTYTATIYPGPKKNLVFNASSCWWADGLSEPPGYVRPAVYTKPLGPDKRAQRITSNLLARMCAIILILLASTRSWADVGDPQIGTDHPFYPGELACSTFEQLFASESEQYRRATQIDPTTDEDKALASWYWRNTHYFHGEEGAEDLWGTGFTKGGDLRTREYWTGLFAHGFGLCGTTHSQWSAEMEPLLGHGRGRAVGVQGHNSFEVFLAHGSYGAGKWSLLDHDISTVVFDEDGKRLLSIPEIKQNVKQWTDRGFRPQKQHGWIVCGLDGGDGAVYRDYTTAEYLPGYASVPPMVHLRRGETLRRYLNPGLEDGKSFVFWGRNYKTAGIPGPERSQTWVNQPEKMHGSTKGTGYKPGQARYANAVYVYKPDFQNGDYREGVIDENGDHVTFEFYSPYIIGATPPNDKSWGIYDGDCSNGLVLNGSAKADVSVSVDQGRTWNRSGELHDDLDLTDLVKGHRQYFLRIDSNAKALANSGLSIRTVCQANVAIMPRLKDNGSAITFANRQQAVVSAGPNKPQAAAHIVAGAFDSPTVTLELSTPHRESVRAIYASAHLASGNPPSPQTKYQLEFSTDKGRTWLPLVKDWRIPRMGDEPADFWSQSLCYGSTNLTDATTSSVQVRVRNDGGKKCLRAEAHLVYRTAGNDPVKVAFGWKDSGGEKTASHLFAPGTSANWQINTGTGVETRWVDFAVVP